MPRGDQRVKSGHSPHTVDEPPPSAIHVELTPPQWEFYNKECDFPAFIGGFGSGKTQTMIMRALTDFFAFPGANIGLYAPTYDLIRLNLLPRVIELLEAGRHDYSLNRSQMMVYVKHHGALIFRSLTNPERIVAYEVFRSHIDELDILRFKDAELAWNKIIARNRQRCFYLRNPKDKNSERVYGRQRVSAYTTPEGFNFIYEKWHKNPPSDQYQYVKAPTYSNPFLPADYVANLRASYPENLIDAYIEGEFVNLVGKSVYSSFNRFANDSTITPNTSEPIYLGMDFNVGKMAVIALVRRPDGFHAVWESFGLLDTPNVVDAVEERFPKNPKAAFPDASAKNRHTGNATISDIKIMKRKGWAVKCNTQNPRIRDRVLAVNAAFGNAKNEPQLYINSTTCPNTVLCLEQQVWTDSGIPDKSQDNDHIPDALGYFVHKMIPLAKPETSGGVTIQQF